MKKLLNVSSFILLVWFTIFISCSKNPSPNGSLPPPPQPLDSLSGREFEFNDLTWREIQSSGPNVIAEIDRPDLFFNPFRVLKVTARLDTSAVWLDVPRDQGSPYPGGFNFFYTVGGSDIFYTVSGRLYIFPLPANYSLKGTKVSIRVKFL